MGGDTNLLMLEADDDGLLPILLAAAEEEDAGNLVVLTGEEGPWPTPIDNLNSDTNKINTIIDYPLSLTDKSVIIMSDFSTLSSPECS